MNLTYKTKRVVDGEIVKTETAIPLTPCTESSGYVMSGTQISMSMMCFDDLPFESSSLVGDFFSNEFNYLQVSLKPCLSDVEGVCGTKDEVKAFYTANPAL